MTMDNRANAEASLTVIMPAYNEETLIENAVREVQEEIFKRLPQSRLIVIDDGSRDNTGVILDELAKEDDRIMVVHQKNGGHGKALITGIERAQSEFIFLIDSDQQIPLTAFASLWEATAGQDGVFGVRVQRHDPTIRLVLTRFIRFFIRWCFGFTIYDANVPCKIIRRDIWEQARPLIPPDTLAPSLFLAIFMRHSGMRIVENTVPHKMRDSPSLGLKRQWSLFKLTCVGFLQLINLRNKLLNPIV